MSGFEDIAKKGNRESGDSRLSKSGGGLGSSSDSGHSGPGQADFVELKPGDFGGAVDLETVASSGDSVVGWRQLEFANTTALADVWFEPDFTVTPILDFLDSNQTRLGSTAHMLYRWAIGDENSPESNISVVPEMAFLPDARGKRIAFDKSALGLRFMEWLTGKGVTWSFNVTLPQGSPDFPADPDSKYEIIGQWGTTFGTPYLQSIRLYESPDGKETLLWSIAALSNSRSAFLPETFEIESDDEIYIAVNKSPDNVPVGKWPELVDFPELAKCLFFLAETPFPTQGLASFSRNLAYSDIPREHRPVPSWSIEHTEFACGVYVNPEVTDSLSYSGAYHDRVLRLGWTFTLDSFEHWDQTLPVVTDGLTRISSILEDGYRNFNSYESASPFDIVTGAEAVRSAEYKIGSESALGYGRWVPLTHIGVEIRQTELRYNLAEDARFGNSAERTRLMALAAYSGMGATAAAAVNTLVYSWAIPAERYEEAYRLLEIVIAMHDPDQVVVGLGNRGIVNFLTGNLEQSHEDFESVLSAPESRRSEDEAYFFLSLLARAKGDIASADKWARECEDAGGYLFEGMTLEVAAERLLPRISTVQDSSVTAAVPAIQTGLAKFCAQCGTPRASENARFCAGCGAPLDS